MDLPSKGRLFILIHVVAACVLGKKSTPVHTSTQARAVFILKTSLRLRGRWWHCLFSVVKRQMIPPALGFEGFFVTHSPGCFMFLRDNRYANISDDHESRLTKYRLAW